MVPAILVGCLGTLQEPADGSVCAAESDAAVCLRHGVECGSFAGEDNCGDLRAVPDCGACASDEDCGGGGVENVCGSDDSSSPAEESTCTEDELRCETGVLQQCVSDSWQEKEDFAAQGQICANETCIEDEPSPQTLVELHGGLGIEGSTMVDQHGDPVQLKGMSLFWHNWMGQYYNAGAVSWLAQDWNISVVRAAIAVDVEGGYLEDEGDAKEKARAVINAAIDQGIYVIVDWHTHSVDNNRGQAKAFFEEMAKEYGDKPNIIYEVFNEPVNQSWSDIKSYAEEIIAAIRAIDPDNIILVGCRSWSQEILEPAGDPITDYDNIAYTAHFYAGTHHQSLRDRVKAALDQGIHVFISEWGTSQADGGSDGVVHTDETNAWLDFLDQHNLSWCNWSIADKAEASAALQPDASGDGGWSDSELSDSGLFVRARLIGQRDP